MNSLTVLISLSFITLTASCSAGKGSASPEPQVPASDGQASRVLGNKPVPGPDGVPLACDILYEGLCYPNADAACAKAGCAIDQCEIHKTYPGRVHCQTKTLHPPAPGDTFALIGEGSGPDDGAGFNLIVGVAATPGSGFELGIGRSWRDDKSCTVEVSSAWYFEIENRREFEQETPIKLPYGDGSGQTADWLAPQHHCGDASRCSKADSGSLQMDSLLLGNTAIGSYRFETSTGPVRNTFHAQWCGPSTYWKTQ